MFTRWKLYRKFRKEVDRKAVEREAVAWTKAYFKRRGIPNWTSEYQNTFAVHVLKYVENYVHSYAKAKLNKEITKSSSE